MTAVIVESAMHFLFCSRCRDYEQVATEVDAPDHVAAAATRGARGERDRVRGFESRTWSGEGGRLPADGSAAGGADGGHPHPAGEGDQGGLGDTGPRQVRHYHTNMDLPALIHDALLPTLYESNDLKPSQPDSLLTEPSIFNSFTPS